MKRVRCAVYTRKSSEEGLEQDFNSLDAQREACSAYVLSQASEGWLLLPDHYDDGGVSGGTLERPALQRLLADVADGRIDVVVVYKVDRLSRSLFDFAKLVEVFDKAEVSFVSVTQSFNTTTSMGRLTLNMLLSFAQFEREVTAERIRDKIAASKARGMWMGGTPPLGYRPDGRSLAIVEEHAALVRDIYQRYVDLGTVRRVAEQLEREGVRTPRRSTATGKTFGGCVYSRGQLYAILRNPIYVGDIPHKGELHAGLHPAIIERLAWDRVQAMLTDNTQGHAGTRAPHRSLLAGLMVDAAGEPMLATHATKQAVRYRYYVSRSLQTGSSTSGLRLPAREIEAVVKEQVAQLFDDALVLAGRLGIEVRPALLQPLHDHCAEIAARVRSRGGGPLRDIVTRIRATDESLEIEMSVTAVAGLLGVQTNDAVEATLVLGVAYRLTRTGRAVRLVHDGGSPARRDADAPLVGLVVKARKWWSMLADGAMNITELAEQEGVQDAYVTRVVRIAFLSPQVIDAILAGRQHGRLDAGQLRLAKDLPARWDEQAARFLPDAKG